MNSDTPKDSENVEEQPQVEGQEQQDDKWQLEKEFQAMTEDGEWVSLRGHRLLVFPTLITEINETIKRLDSISDSVGNFQWEEMIDFALWALKPTYPNLEEEDISKVLDLKGFQRVYKAIIALNELEEILSLKNMIGLGAVMLEDGEEKDRAIVPAGDSLEESLEKPSD